MNNCIENKISASKAIRLVKLRLSADPVPSISVKNRFSADPEKMIAHVRNRLNGRPLQESGQKLSC